MRPVNSPFKFLDSYQQEDADIFFGRETETDALYNALSGVKHLLVYGPSGAGKTSLIECGLRNQFSDADWFALSIRRLDTNLTQSVFREINKALHEKIDLDPQTKLPKNPDFDFGEAIENLFAERYQPVYLLFDQFEELLILGDEAEKKDFFTRLNRLIRYKVPCRVMLVMREEFIGHLSEFEPLCPSIFQHRFRLEKMGRSNVQAVIQQILEAEKYQSDFRVEQPETLAKSILAKLPDTQREIELAHVQVFLEELWDRATAENKTQKPTLHSGLVNENDNLERVLDSFLKKQLEQLERSHGEKVPLELLAAMISERHTKLQLGAGDLENALAKNGVALQKPLPDLLRDLEQRRIIRTLKSGEQTQFEISHDVLALVVGNNLTPKMIMRKDAERAYLVYAGKKGYFSQEDLDYLRPLEQYLAFSDKLKERFLESENHLKEQIELAIKREREELEKAKKQAEQERQLRKSAEDAQREAEMQKNIALNAKVEAENEKNNAERNAIQARHRTRLAVGLAFLAIGVAIWAFFLKKEADKQKKIAEKSQAETLTVLKDLAKNEEALRETFQIAQIEKNRADSALTKSLAAAYNQFVAEGKSAMESSEYEQAIRNFTSALSAIRDQPKIISDNGQSCRSMLSICQQMLSQKALFKEAIQSGDIYMEKGVIYVLEAIDEYQKAIQTGFNDSFAESKLTKAIGEKKAAFLVLKDKGMAFANAGRCDYAIYFFNKARKIFQDEEIENKLKSCANK